METYEKDYQDIFGPFVDKTRYLTLKRTSKIEDFKNDRVRGILERAYSQDDIDNRFLATLMNCIFTQTSKTFIMTSRGFIKIMKDDPNGNGKGIDFKTYSVQKCRLHDLGYLITLRNPIGQKSGVYQLAIPLLLELLHKQCSDEYFEAQEKAVLSYYDKGPEDKGIYKNTPRWEDL